ncbi:MAG TPA: NUDIX hydrolase [Candidatus Saccharimonadales bacterium]|nr:NUDIX hydrolase [Candidatus Saccharimonadales bacterium]
MATWQRIEPTKVTKVGWRKVVSKTFKMPDGQVEVFDTLHPDGQEFASIIALDKEGRVIIAREFCPGPEKIMYELPGGFVDKGETPDESVRREFLEETGYAVGTLTYLGAYHKDKYMNATWHAYFAIDCAKISKQKLEAEEFIDVIKVPVSDFIKAAKNDKITDHGAVLLAYDLLQKENGRKTNEETD